MYGQNGTGSKKILRNCALGFVFRSSLLSTALSLPGHCLLQYVSVEIDMFRCEQISTQSNLLYLGLVYVTMITGTHCSYSTVVRGVTEV